MQAEGGGGGGGGATPAPSASIQVKGWDAKTPYLTALNDVCKQTATDDGDLLEELLCAFYRERKAYRASPAFFFDCAAFFFATAKGKQNADAFRAAAVCIATSVLELGLEDATLVRLSAYMLRVHGYNAFATQLFAQVLEMRPEEPQSHRDYALGLADMARKASAEDTPLAAIEVIVRKALKHFALCVTGAWDERFAQIEITALQEMNAFVAEARAWRAALGGQADGASKTAGKAEEEDFLDMSRDSLPVTQKLPSELLVNLPLDLRVSLAWDTDMTDIDLHVIEPTGEKAYYANNRTIIGGFVSRDFTRGYGPEEYMIKAAMPGCYKIQAKYFSNSRQDMSGATTLLLTLSTDFGRPETAEHRLTAVRLSSNKSIIDVGEFTVPETKNGNTKTKKEQQPSKRCAVM